jgi:hypothetical protein
MHHTLIYRARVLQLLHLAGVNFEADVVSHSDALPLRAEGCCPEHVLHFSWHAGSTSPPPCPTPILISIPASFSSSSSSSQGRALELGRSRGARTGRHSAAGASARARAERRRLRGPGRERLDPALLL